MESAGGKALVDLIQIGGLRLRCIIGCNQEERRDRSDVVIDLRIGTDATLAAARDDLAEGWDYRSAVKAVITAVEGSSCKTVEALATLVARTLVTGCGAPFVRVRVAKPGAVRFADMAGIEIERTADDFAAEGDCA
jgi:FolB domain-containing protein